MLSAPTLEKLQKQNCMNSRFCLKYWIKNLIILFLLTFIDLINDTSSSADYSCGTNNKK